MKKIISVLQMTTRQTVLGLVVLGFIVVTAPMAAFAVNSQTPTGVLEVKKVLIGAPEGTNKNSFSFVYDKSGSTPPVTVAFNSDGDISQNVATGAYDVSEANVPQNYTVSYSSNQHGHTNDCNNLSVGNDQNEDNHGAVICTITNTYHAPEAPKTCTVSSDETTLANGAPSVATFVVQPPWVSIPGAVWIWKTFLVDTSLVPDTTTFTKTINLSTAPSGATLTIAADNTYTVLVNGVAPACDGTQLDNFSAADTCTVTNLVAGNNILTFTVTNTAGDSDPHANPAGLDYSLAITGASCLEVPPTTPGTLKVHILKYLKTSNGEVAASGELPAFPMSATWSDSIDSGTGTYTLNASGFGGAGAYAADTRVMNAPSNYTTSEITTGDTVIDQTATCSPGKYKLLGYQTGSTLGAAQNAAVTTTPPQLLGITSDSYIIVVNEKCPDAPTTSSVSATKVVCTNEADLPNWGAGGPDITATTATDWVAKHKSCSIVPWDFQWGPKLSW